MDRDTRRFVREAKYETELLIAQCERAPGEEFDNEIEVIIRSSMGGSANLAFFIPYLWKHRH